ncbi:MAG: phosphoenolpyruvate--protein phosphotransferase [Actinobacteria bacterium]|nr:phosphoenolpyruvate--protein phosphotransferase [Actinomycetota bacterium]
MRTLTGVAASSGASVAPAWLYAAADFEMPQGEVDDRGAEVEKLREAVEAVGRALEEKAALASGELAEVLDAQAMMARDPELADSAERAIQDQGTPAAKAISDAGESYAEILAASESQYMAARAEDIRDVCKRIARRAVGAPETSVADLSKPSIIVATELPPADVASLDPELVQGIATQEGSRTSHTAIVARALRIPAVVAVKGLKAAASKNVPIAVDGDEGQIHIEPDDDTKKRLEGKAAAKAARREELKARVPEGLAATKDGHRVEVGANIGAVAELEAALEEGAEGVGLLRTELLYIGHAKAPDEDEQRDVYGTMTELLGDRRLVVRTFDFGADKPVPFLDIDAEENPALGVRGIRLARLHPDLITTQLRAIVRTAVGGRRVGVMAPMVATAEEADWFVEQVEAAGGREAGVEVGAMVEVPAAVLVAGDLAERLDFLSIGTNDLTQYLHAADRQQGALSYLQDPFSPALLRAVQRICFEAHDQAWVGVCGEAAGDPAWALIAVGLGVTELSVGSDSLLEVRVALAEATLDDCRTAAEEAVGAPDPAAARRVAAGLLA